MPACLCLPACLQIVKLWQGDLAKINPKAAESLANPEVGFLAVAAWGAGGQAAWMRGSGLADGKVMGPAPS